MAGFREGAYAKVWDIRPVEGKNATDIRITISSKLKDSNEFRDDFSGFVRLYGNAHTKAGTLQKKDKIKLLSTGVNNSYNAETKETRYYFNVFDYETAEPYANSGNNAPDYPFEGSIEVVDKPEKEPEALPY